MVKIHRLSTVWEDLRIAPLTHSYLAKKPFHFERIEASHLESNSFWSFGNILLCTGKCNTSIRRLVIGESQTTWIPGYSAIEWILYCVRSTNIFVKRSVKNWQWLSNLMCFILWLFPCLGVGEIFWSFI